VATGIELKERPSAKSTLQLLRARLIIHQKARQLFQRSLQKAKESGLFKKHKKLRVEGYLQSSG